MLKLNKSFDANASVGAGIAWLQNRYSYLIIYQNLSIKTKFNFTITDTYDYIKIVVLKKNPYVFDLSYRETILKYIRYIINIIYTVYSNPSKLKYLYFLLLYKK